MSRNGQCLWQILLNQATDASCLLTVDLDEVVALGNLAVSNQPRLFTLKRIRPQLVVAVDVGFVELPEENH